MDWKIDRLIISYEADKNNWSGEERKEKENTHRVCSVEAWPWSTRSRRARIGGQRGFLPDCLPESSCSCCQPTSTREDRFFRMIERHHDSLDRSEAKRKKRKGTTPASTSLLWPCTLRPRRGRGRGKRGTRGRELWPPLEWLRDQARIE